MGRNKLTRQRFSGEKHIPLITRDFLKVPTQVQIANYAGPGTNLKRRLEEGFKPLTQGDKSAQAHDIRYTLAKTPKDVRDADNKLIEATKKIDRGQIKDNETKYHNKANTFAIRNAMRLKKFGEDVGVIDKNTFTNVLSEDLTPEYKKKLEDKLHDLEKLGYGNILLSNKKFYDRYNMALERNKALNEIAKEFNKMLIKLNDKGIPVPDFGGNLIGGSPIGGSLIGGSLIGGSLIGGMVSMIDLISQLQTDPLYRQPTNEEQSPPMNIDIEAGKQKQKKKKKLSPYFKMVRELRNEDPTLTYNEAREIVSRTIRESKNAD